MATQPSISPFTTIAHHQRTSNYRVFNVDAVASTGSSTITFDLGRQWWNGNGSRSSGEYSYEGILVHEMGHTVGMGHSGGFRWSDDGAAPSMQDCVASGGSVGYQTIERDDWSHAANIGGHASGKTPFLNANPGFERGTSHWGTSSTSLTNSAKRTGAYGVRLNRAGAFVWIGTSYDPWDLDSNDSQVRVSRMSLNVSFRIRADHRHTSPSTTGGVQLRWNRRSLRYDEYGGSCKTSAGGTHGSWLGQVALGTACSDPGTTWKLCARQPSSPEIFQKSGNDAMILRPLVLSTSSGYAYIDRVGIEGGTSK